MSVVRSVFSMAFVGLLGVLVLAGCGAPASSGSSGSSNTSGSREFKVTATDFKFDPANQDFKPGEKLKVTMQNKGAVDHTWVLQDSSGAELVKLEVKVGATASKEFTAPAAGTYNIICDIAGHKEAGMTAKATIK